MESYSSYFLRNPWVIATYIILYVVSRAVYHLYFSPLAKFPGPKLAAITRWYETYYEVIYGGRYVFRIQELHEKYGPVLRVNPYEIHINDPEFYDTLFSHTGRRERWEGVRVRFNVPDAITNTPSHELHRKRRAPLQAMFSKQKVAIFEPYIQEKLDILSRVMREYERDGKVMRLDHATAALTGDIISEFAFAKSFNALESKDFSESLHDTFLAAVATAPVTLQFPWLVPLMNSLPQNWVIKLQPELSQLFRIQTILSQQVEDIRHNRNEAYKSAKHPTVFRELLDSNSLPEIEKQPVRLMQQAQSVIGAGLSTTAWALCVGCYHILSNPEIEQRLRDELRQAIPVSSEAALLVDLEKLPYLKACIYESIRLSYGVVSRLQRIAPDETLTYKQWTFPPGTLLSQSIYIVNHDETVFPDSYTFQPERWIAGGVKMERYLFSFSKGNRMCLGMNLAYAELYKTMALFFRRFKMELYETDYTDIACKHDHFIPAVRKDSKGVKIKIVGVE